MTPEDKKELLGHLNHLANLRKKQAGVSTYRMDAAEKGMNAIIFDLRHEQIHVREPMRPSHELLGG